MTDLKMTTLRLAVLRAVQRGEVTRHRGWGVGEKPQDFMHDGGGRRTVTRTCNELASVEPRLIRPGRQTGKSIFSPQPWEITDAGRQALAALETATKEN